MKFHELAKVASRTRSSGKPECYFRARAYDEALGGALGESDGLFMLTAWFYWTKSGMSIEAGKSGSFNLSSREVESYRSNEKSIIRRKAGVATAEPMVVRGPSEGAEGFSDSVRKAHEHLRTMIAGGPKAFREWLPKEAEWVFWNQKDTESPVDGDKGADTLAYPVLSEWKDEDIVKTLAWFKANLISDEEAEAYKYVPPTE